MSSASLPEFWEESLIELFKNQETTSRENVETNKGTMDYGWIRSNHWFQEWV